MADGSGSESEDGHEKDRQEDPGEFLDATFSRGGIWNVVIGFSFTTGIAHLVLFLALNVVKVPLKLNLALAVIWLGVLFPVAVVGGMFWPDIEQKYADRLPWMDSDT